MTNAEFICLERARCGTATERDGQASGRGGTLRCSWTGFAGSHRPGRPFGRAGWIVWAVVAVVALTSHAHADDDTVIYRVRPGDTLKLVAAEYYGDHQHTTIFLMVANKLHRQRKLIPGEKLRIPVSRDITTARGDTFPSLAKAYLGDETRAAFLAEFNKMSPTVSLATGTVLTIPIRVTHTAAGRETLEQISQWYFGDAKQAGMLRAYNHLETSQLDKNDSLIVPDLRLRVRAEKLPAIDAAAMARREQQKQTNAEALVALPRARSAWLQGDFAGVKNALGGFANKLDFLEAGMAADVGFLLGKAYVAFDDAASATAIFALALTRQHRELSAYYESPKVLAAWTKAGGKIRDQTETTR